MSNKLELQNNNIDLQGILTKVNTLPKKENIDEEVDTIENLTEQIKLALEGKAAGGDGKIFAAIGVTYPEGSVCTCTNGTKTMEAGNTNGQWVFAIPEEGTWTVTATLGTNTKSQSVSIITEGQWESVVLSYQLVLFDGGDITANTGGWDYDGHSTEPIVGSELGLDIDSETLRAYKTFNWILATVNPIDLSDYTKLCAKITGIDLRGDDDGAWLCVASSIADDATLKASQAITKTGTVSADISNVSSGYVGLKLEIVSDAYAQLIGSISASKIWLE